MLRCVNSGVTTIKPGHDNSKHMIWSNESSFTLFPTSRRAYIWRTPKKAYNPECLVPTVKHRGGFVMVWAAILWYRLGYQVHPMIQALPNNDAVFQDNNDPFTQLELFSHGFKRLRVNLTPSLASIITTFEHQ
jgi:hypothetical protein